jgi:predicted Zn-dependent protease
MSDVPGRIAIALAAALVAAALAVELRAHDLLAHASHRATAPKLTPAKVDATLHDLKRVTDLRPGSQALLLAAGLDMRTRRYQDAERLAAHATRREPDNFATWVTLGVARSAAGDATGAKAAYARAHVLNPLYPVPR